MSDELTVQEKFEAEFAKSNLDLFVIAQLLRRGSSQGWKSAYQGARKIFANRRSF